MTKIAAFCVISIALSFVFTKWALWYAVRNAVVDIPNDRSSHTIPTPRGGGIGIVFAALVTISIANALGFIPFSFALALAGPGFAVAALGWVDDHSGLTLRLRVVVQMMAAVWAIYLFGGLGAVHFGTTNLNLGVAGPVLAVLGLVWLTNLFNFMDGIDGIAGVQAATVTGIGSLLLFRAGDMAAATTAACLAGGALGFLRWNWPAARIFMGDVGSTFLGLSIATLAVITENRGSLALCSWITLLAVFITDATVTLIRRILRGQRVGAAHRSHAYQRLVQAGWSHRRVTTSVLFVNLLLGGLTYLGSLRPTWVVAAMIVGLLMCGALYGAVERIRPMAE